MEQEQRRIKILQKRLRLLAEYLDRFNSSDNAPTFAQFIKSKGVTREMFIKDLPPGLPDVPASGMDNILEYALILQELLNGINNLAEMEKMSADGDDLRAGLIKYEGGQYIKDDCGCGCGGDDKDCGQDGGNYSGSGGEQGGESVALNYILDDSGGRFDDYMSFAASGSNKICLKPIAPIISEKIAPGMWRSYRNKITAYNACVSAKKAAGGYTLQDKASHALHLSNPSEALGRTAFLKLIAMNIFGLAQTYEKMRKHPNQSHWNSMKLKWYRMGGDPKKLDSNISQGQAKKPIFRPKGWKPKGSNADGGIYSADGTWYNGEAYTAAGIAALIVAATGAIAAMAPIVKSFKKDNGIPESEIADDPLNPDMRLPEDDLPPIEGDGLLDNINWAIAAPIGIVLLIGIGFAIYKATK